MFLSFENKKAIRYHTIIDCFAHITGSNVPIHEQYKYNSNFTKPNNNSNTNLQEIINIIEVI